MSKKSFNPINIGVDKQLFIDDQIIESMSLGVHKISNQPVKHPDNPVIRLGSEWEQKGVLSHGGDAGSIFFDDEREIFNRSINFNKCKSSGSDWKNANSH